MAIIYRCRRVETNQCYVGHTTNEAEFRWAAHMALLRVGKHHSRYLQHAWNKYGPGAFVFEIIEICDDKDKLVREQFYIDTLDSCYNTAKVAGSRLGVLYTQEQKIKLSAQRMGHITTEQAKFKIGQFHAGKQWKLGYKLTPEQLARQWFRDPEKSAAAALKRVGQKRTEIQLEHMRVAQQNNPLAGQHRVGFKEAPEQTERRLALARAAKAANPVIWITDGKVNHQHPEADPIPDGWYQGRTLSRDSKESILAASSGIWYTDGKKNKRVPDGEAPPDGWWRGMTKGIKS